MQNNSSDSHQHRRDKAYLSRLTRPDKALETCLQNPSCLPGLVRMPGQPMVSANGWQSHPTIRKQVTPSNYARMSLSTKASPIVQQKVEAQQPQQFSPTK
jgi:hypothetical protein